MLQHIECPRCHAPNLSTDYFCFACGTGLKALPKRLGGAPPAAAPWPMWIGILLLLALAAFFGYHAIVRLAGYRQLAAWPLWYLPAAGAVMVLAGQLAFLEARRREANSWRLKRAPELPLSQSHTGDAVWARGKVACETPIVPSYFPQECAYYHYVVREREPGQSGWHVRERDTNAVDFRLVQDDRSVYVPSGCVRFDAPIYIEQYLDPDLSVQLKLWAIPVGLQVALCARIAGDTEHPRAGLIEDDLPGVVTWRLPQDYVAMVAKQARLVSAAGWTLTVFGVIALIAGLVREVT
ncbi:MAG: hypothetical protein ACE149_07630 [Armatimonadota bacterium]